MSVINREPEHGVRPHVFVHVPKTAGTSMERLSWVGGCAHLPAFALVPEALDLFSWGFVRNPFDRLVSSYYSIRQNPGHESPDMRVGFRDYVLRLGSDARHLWVHAHLHPMTWYLCDAYGAVMVDFVGRYERLQDDWRRVCAALNAPPGRLMRWNTTTERPQTGDAYDTRTAAVVRRLYADDFAVFGYSTDVPE